MRRGKPCIQRQNTKWYRGEQNPILCYHVAQHNGGSSTISRSLNANNFGSIVNSVSTIRHAVLTWRYTRLAPFDGESTPCSPRVAFLPLLDCCSQVAEASWRVAITHASFLMALNRVCGQVSLMRRRAQMRDTWFDPTLFPNNFFSLAVFGRSLDPQLTRAALLLVDARPGAPATSRGCVGMRIWHQMGWASRGSRGSTSSGAPGSCGPQGTSFTLGDG